MNPQMWNNPATQKNLMSIKNLATTFVDLKLVRLLVEKMEWVEWRSQGRLFTILMSIFQKNKLQE